ncbi:MAG: hypothetical protein ACR2NA_02230 [Solirubrobacterales bacterium]
MPEPASLLPQTLLDEIDRAAAIWERAVAEGTRVSIRTTDAERCGEGIEIHARASRPGRIAATRDRRMTPSELLAAAAGDHPLG